MPMTARYAPVLCAISTVLVTACTAAPPKGDVVELTREAMVAAARLRDEERRPARARPRASQAVDAVEAWRGADAGTDARRTARQ